MGIELLPGCRSCRRGSRGSRSPCITSLVQSPKRASLVRFHVTAESIALDFVHLVMAGKTTMKLNTRCKYVDFGDGCWLTTFHEGAQDVLGMAAEKVAELDTGSDGRERLEGALRQRFFLEPLELKVRARLEMYQGEARANVSCVSAAPVNRREHGRRMLSEIYEMLN